MGAAYLVVDAQVLRDILRLPSDSQIVCSCEAASGTVKLLVDHPSIDADAASVTAVFRRQEPIVFQGFQTTERSPTKG